MGPHILVVEDEAAIAELVRYNLEAEGLPRTIAARRGGGAAGRRGPLRPRSCSTGCCPGCPGIELCRRLRRRDDLRALPILMLTARGEEGDRVRGLATGADDYVVKPFSVPELWPASRRCCAARLRSASPTSCAPATSCSTAPRTASRAATREVRLGPTEFKLLAFFMENAGRVLSRQQLLDGVWGRDAFIDGRTVDVHVGRLRKALIRGADSDPIRTVRGAGYVFDGKAN